MGMSLYVYAIRDMSGDGEFDRMVAAKEACEAAGVDMPEAVIDYLNRICEDGAYTDLDTLMANAGAVNLNYDCPADCQGAVEDYKEDMRDGFEVDLTKLPAWATKLRFVVSF